MVLQSLALVCAIALTTSCEDEKKGKPIPPGATGDTVINRELNQYARIVDSLPHFNGASCLICVDVHRLSNEANLQWSSKANNDPSYPQWDPAASVTAIVNDINTRLAACPAGSNAKIQFLYHQDPKPALVRGANGKVSWDPGATLEAELVESVLQSLAQAADVRIKKIYLTSCSSHGRPSTVNSAFGIASVTNVVTVDDVIVLDCGNIKGATYPYMFPNPVNVILWIRQGNNQVALTPERKVAEDELFDINTNTIKPR
jgi:hypothetical protein